MLVSRRQYTAIPSYVLSTKCGHAFASSLPRAPDPASFSRARATMRGDLASLGYQQPWRPLPPGLDLTVYRIIQEALTNALKYAGGAQTQVRVEFDECELRVEVLDSGGMVSDGTAGAGRGLMGMHERVAVYGGELEAGRRPDGGFFLRARLPLQPI